MNSERAPFESVYLYVSERAPLESVHACVWMMHVGGVDDRRLDTGTCGADDRAECGLGAGDPGRIQPGRECVPQCSRHPTRGMGLISIRPGTHQHARVRTLQGSL